MVVTRRAPAPPVPTSRTNSAQPIPRSKGKAPHTVPDVPSPLSNGASRAGPVVEGSDPDPKGDEVAGKKGKGKLKGKHRKDKEDPGKQSTFKGLLTRILLLWFTVYVITVCPDDDKLQSPICHGLYTYRTHVLEPYIFPPIHSALNHPSVAPYVNRARPYIARAITSAKPLAVRAHYEWTTRVVPQWEKTVVPQWQKRVVPQWERYAGPYIARAEQQVAPYVLKAQTEYERRLGPHLRVAGYNLHRWQQQARPYVVLAAHRTYDGYLRVKPYAIPVLQQLQALLVRLSKFLGEQRRQFVDPHVKKIWERVNELSNGEARPASDVGQQFTASASITPSSLSSAAVPVSASPSAPVSASITPSLVPTLEVIVPVPSVDTSLAEDLVSTAASIVSSVTETLASVASSVVLDGTASSSSSVPGKTIATAPPAEESIDASGRWASAQDQPASTAIQADSPEPSVTPQASTGASGGTDEILEAPPAAPATGEDDPDADDFLEKFYAELGLDLDAEERTPASPSESPAVETETEEEKAEKHRLQMEDIAKKRADITGRHSGWEEQLEEKMKANRKALRTTLVALRKAATQELKDSKEIRKEIENLVDEAEKYLKGAEKYMIKLGQESRPDEEKNTIWSRVVEKVDKKFEERLAQTETVVNGWYLGVVEKEIAEVRRLAAEVKDIADRAQADVGLDYAYLEDVTYKDWQRYHDLERKSDNFTAYVLSVQDGSHPSPPVNPVLPAIQELQDEVQDVVVGFETRLRRIKRNGERAFSAAVDADEVIHDDAPSDETVSILPIDDDTHKAPVDDESPAVPPVVIGRSKQEILSALERAAEVEAQATSAPDDKHTEPEQVVASLAQEAVAEGSLAATPLHEEL